MVVDGCQSTRTFAIKPVAKSTNQVQDGREECKMLRLAEKTAVADENRTVPLTRDDPRTWLFAVSSA